MQQRKLLVYGAALALFALGVWAAYWGWRQDLTLNSAMMRGGGLFAILAAIYILLRSRRP
jgi:hypothetical protein